MRVFSLIVLCRDQTRRVDSSRAGRARAGGWGIHAGGEVEYRGNAAKRKSSDEEESGRKEDGEIGQLMDLMAVVRVSGLVS